VTLTFATLRYELADGIATVTINRPEKNNAISMEMRADFRTLSDELYANEAVRVVVFTGTGKTFSVGADVSTFEMDWNTPVFRANTRLLTSFFNDLEALEKPLIAAINGTCVGGGLELALACDLRIAARSARFGLPENNLGLIPGIGGCSRLVKLVGFGRAKELVLTGEIVGADEALRFGLVNRVVDDDALASEAGALAARLAGKAPQALGLAKRVIQSCVSADLYTARTLESFGQSILIKTADHREGVRAFREKRRPRFEGR
jgi:enoyl-CoA hydratase/carnithine racemase